MAEPTPVLPEVLAQIKTIPASDRPLIICDIDEVVLHMIAPLEAFLNERGLMFRNHTYLLTGNIARSHDNSLLSAPEVRQILGAFFEEVCSRQDEVVGASKNLQELAEDWEIVFLTNLPGGHNKPLREKLLRERGMAYPLITNSGPKGGAVAALAGGRKTPVIFIDDSPTNHHSVNATLPASVQIQFVADERFLRAVEKPDHVALLTNDWQETASFISGIL